MPFQNRNHLNCQCDIFLMKFSDFWNKTLRNIYRELQQQNANSATSALHRYCVCVCVCLPTQISHIALEEYKCRGCSQCSQINKTSFFLLITLLSNSYSSKKNSWSSIFIYHYYYFGYLKLQYATFFYILILDLQDTEPSSSLCV